MFFNFASSFKNLLFMLRNQLKILALLSSIVFLHSCLGDSEVTEISSDPSFVSLTFSANDSVPNLEDAVFTLEYDALLKDSVIVNMDSLPYQTRIDSVYATFIFKSSYAAYLIYENDSSAIISGSEAFDFTKIKAVLNIASDGVAQRKYPIKVNVHQVEPELYIWQKVSNAAHSLNVQRQKAVYFNDRLYLFVNDGQQNYLLTSSNGSAWTQSVVSGLPANATFEDLTVFNNRLYVTCGDSKIYSSTDGLTWTMQTYSEYEFTSLIFALNERLWAISHSLTDGKLRFASSVDGTEWLIYNEIPENFPVRGFASVVFDTKVNKQKGLVLTGFSSDGTALKTNWSTENGTYWVDFSVENTSLDSIGTGASLITYDDKLFLFGQDNKPVPGSYFRQSIDEGFSWQVPDSDYNNLPEEIAARHYSSVVVYQPRIYSSSDTPQEIEASNWIFFIGGKNVSNEYLTDVWKGKVNRKNFLRQ